MKSKMKIKMKIAGKLWGLSAILLFVSCAKGFDDNETFSGGVTNAQLESPVIDDNSFSTLTNSDGTESVKITWPVVMGAGGYLLNVDLIEDPADPTVTTENPVVVMQDSVVDGSSVVFTKTEDATYKIKIKTLRHSYLLIIAIMLTVISSRTASAQSIAVNSNILYDLTGTLNLGGEIR